MNPCVIFVHHFDSKVSHMIILKRGFQFSLRKSNWSFTIPPPPPPPRSRSQYPLCPPAHPLYSWHRLLRFENRLNFSINPWKLPIFVQIKVKPYPRTSSIPGISLRYRFGSVRLLKGNTIMVTVVCFVTPLPSGAAEETVVCFVVPTSVLASANRVHFGLCFCFINFQFDH